MPAFLVPVDPGHCLIPLEKAIVLIGRQSDCDVALTLSRKISRKHCCVAQVNKKYVVRDLGSTNGVYLNGTRIKKEATLSFGDDLMIGDVHFRMQADAKSIVNRAKPPVPRTPESQTFEEASSEAIPQQGQGDQTAPPSLDIPIALAEGKEVFEVEETSLNKQVSLRKKRVDDVIPLNDVIPLDSDEEEENLMLASDNF
ncbi:FHA domain-containing protein [Schlesneria sp. T3-172]|uniref:FHA domain-containing protein n=1 Tax=Schlesneria sphaerica TaxID=3373610 RepID=UPI0037C5BC11